MKKLMCIGLLFIISIIGFAQSVGINADGTAPNSSAMLDVKSTTKGFLAPRLTAAQKSAIASPATGLLVYQTDGTEGYYYYNGSSWTQIGSALWTDNLEGGIYTTSNNVGIGTTSPTALLDVEGIIRSTTVSLGIDNEIWNSGNASDAGAMYVNHRGYNDSFDYYRDFHIGNGKQETIAFFDGSSGYVGIGTTTPEAKLHITGFGHSVAGGITMTPVNDTEGGHYMTFTNAASTTDIGSIARGPGETVVYNTSSDYRLKENVVNLDIDQAKSRLMSLRPVEYNYISDQNKTVISGFLAHEMAEAGFANGVTGEKDAVDKDGEPIYQAIDTKFLIPEMVKVIQEQQETIGKQKDKIENQQKQIDELYEMVEQLKNKQGS